MSPKRTQIIPQEQHCIGDRIDEKLNSIGDRIDEKLNDILLLLTHKKKIDEIHWPTSDHVQQINVMPTQKSEVEEDQKWKRRPEVEEKTNDGISKLVTIFGRKINSFVNWYHGYAPLPKEKRD